MIKKSLILLIFFFSFFLNTSIVLADHLKPPAECTATRSDPNGHCIEGSSCQRSQTQPNRYICQGAPFGQIDLPDPLKGFIGKDPTGAFGISQFLSNAVALFYTVAAVVLIFMLLWGAFDWMTSEGDKEKVNSARNKIISAVMGMLLFAATFAVIQVVGHFTGFTFFKGQNP